MVDKRTFGKMQIPHFLPACQKTSHITEKREFFLKNLDQSRPKHPIFSGSACSFENRYLLTHDSRESVLAARACWLLLISIGDQWEVLVLYDNVIK